MATRAIAEYDIGNLVPEVHVASSAGAGSDDSAAINAAIDAALAYHALGFKANVHFGPKTYIYTTPHARLTKPVGFIGHGSMSTVISLATGLSGDVFSWSEVWLKTTPPTYSDFGVRLRGFSIVGDRTTSNQQNALMFYDRTDDLLIEDVSVWSVRGRALMTGTPSATSQGYMRESRINNFRVFWSGLSGFPVVEFHTAGAGDATNCVRVHSMDIFGSYSEGLVIRNKNSAKNIQQMDFHSLRIEGTISPSPAITADTLVIGDAGATYLGGISQLNFFGVTLIQPYTGQNALTITATDATVGTNIYELNFKGLGMGPGPGGGINIQAGRVLSFEVFENSVSGTKLTIAAAGGGKVGAPIGISGPGLNAGSSASIDSTSAQSVWFATRTNFFATAAPDTAKDGTRGYGIGSLWMIPTTGQTWICRDATTSAAVWVQLGLGTEQPGYIVNNWYVGISAALSAGANPGIGSIRWHPIFIKERMTISALGVRISTLFSGGLVQAAIYANNSTTFRPTGNALASTSSLSTTTATNVNGAVSVQLDIGTYWMATNCDNATAIFSSVGASSTYMTNSLGGAETQLGGSGAAQVGFSTAQTFGTWPDATGASFTGVVASSIPVVQFKVGTVP